MNNFEVNEDPKSDTSEILNLLITYTLFVNVTLEFATATCHIYRVFRQGLGHCDISRYNGDIEIRFFIQNSWRDKYFKLK